MSIRMTLGGGGEKRHDYYTEGYNTGYTSAMDEMRRRLRSQFDTEDRGRTRAEYEHLAPSGNVYLPVEARQIGFAENSPRHSAHHVPPPDTYAHDSMEMLMDMVREIKQGQDYIKQGMGASSKKLDPRLEGVMESAVQILDNPPSTWAQYQHRKDYVGIAKMEGKELLAALEAKKPIQDIRKELTHTIAALFQLVSM